MLGDMCKNNDATQCWSLTCVVEIAHVLCFFLCGCWVLFQCSSSLFQAFTSSTWDLGTRVVDTRTRSWFGALLVSLATVLRSMAHKRQWFGPALDFGCNGAHSFSG